MSKVHSFTLTLKFSDKVVSDEEIREIAQNIANGIKTQIDGSGMAPEDSDAFTEEFSVKHQFLDEVIEIKMI